LKHQKKKFLFVFLPFTVSCCHADLICSHVLRRCRQLFVDRQNPKETDDCRRKMEPYVNEMLSELKHAYRVREEQLSSVARDCRTHMRAIVRRHELLIAAYRWGVAVSYCPCPKRESV